MTPDILALMQGLTEQQKNYVLSAQARQKDTGLAYLFWFVFGVHYFYLNKPVINIIYWLTAGGLGIWMIIDLFRIPGMVRSRNKKIIQDAIKEAKVLYPEV
ncbi:TM2 domain-containing protein [uncultured Veillonella sp.]|uniref:TM2 domain-containing protein n=1 Tax=uncultured Veillonella sp. TaxID=159268 RepID=UPI0028DC14DD|nr:TM2 domain-containing protein [uncultured Veillonella sp.]